MGITQQIGASSIIKPGVIDNTAARPASPYEGQVIFQKDTDQLLVWNGTAWVIPNSPAQNPQGLELVTTVTCTSGGTASGGVITVGSAQSSVVVATAFSSTYDNYRIIYTGGVNSGDAGMGLSLGASATGYYSAQGYIGYGAGSTISYLQNTNATSWANVATALISGAFMDVDLTRPFLAVTTGLTVNSRTDMRTAGASSFGGGFHNVATSYTGFTVTPGAGTLTGGTIRVYGYRNS